MTAAVTEAIYNRLVAATLGCPVYRNVPPPKRTPPYVVVGGATENVRPITLDGAGQGMTKTISIVAERKADSSAVDDLAEAVAVALNVAPRIYVATGYTIERIVVTGPIDLDLDDVSYGRSIALSLEVMKV
jgi:hypothetical protein